MDAMWINTDGVKAASKKWDTFNGFRTRLVIHDINDFHTLAACTVCLSLWATTHCLSECVVFDKQL